jgi:hypothetical protein
MNYFPPNYIIPILSHFVPAYLKDELDPSIIPFQINVSNSSVGVLCPGTWRGCFDVIESEIVTDLAMLYYALCYRYNHSKIKQIASVYFQTLGNYSAKIGIS